MRTGHAGEVERSAGSEDSGSTRWARRYFALQAVAGATWWVLVFASDDVQRWTLGYWDPAWIVGPDVVLFVCGSALAAATGHRHVAVATALWTAGVTGALAAHGLVDRTAGWGVIAMTLASVGTVAAAATLWSRRLPLGWFFVGPFSFRPAVDRPVDRHLRRSLVQLVVFWSVFFLVIPIVVSVAERRLRIDWPALGATGWTRSGIALFGLGSAVGLWSCVTMAVCGRGTPLPAETARELVVAGPYRIVRNPMALAGAVQTAGVGLWIGSWVVVVLAVAGAFAWHIAIRPVEEADLADRFGAAYESYRRDVRCWIPRVMSRRSTG